MTAYFIAGLWAVALFAVLFAAAAVLAWWLDVVAAVIADLLKGPR